MLFLGLGNTSSDLHAKFKVNFSSEKFYKNIETYSLSFHILSFRKNRESLQLVIFPPLRNPDGKTTYTGLTLKTGMFGFRENYEIWMHNDHQPLSFILQKVELSPKKRLALHQNSSRKSNYHQKRLACLDWLKLAIFFLEFASFFWLECASLFFPFSIWVCISLIALGSN